MAEFQNWYFNLKASVKDLHITSGDSKFIDAKLHELKVWLVKSSKECFSLLHIPTILYILQYLSWEYKRT